MIARLKTAGLLWPLVLTIISLVILLMLGNWQMRRMVWKETLIETVQQRLKLEPITYAALKKRALAGRDVRYQPVKVTGEFVHEAERHYFLPFEGKVGWHVLTPLKTTSGDVVIVDRGFVPDRLKDQSLRGDGLPAGQVTVTGLARLFEEQRLFTPENDVSDNKWYWRDGPGLYHSLPADMSAMPLPFMIDAGTKATSGAWPRAGVTRVAFSQKHFGYALTWYGLALTLVGVFAAFAYMRLRRIEVARSSL